jgi:hypothetical protein
VEAKVLARQGHLAEAERLARATLGLVEQTDALSRHADALLALAEVLELGGSQQEAEAAVNEALVLYDKKGSPAAAARVRARLPTTVRS